MLKIRLSRTGKKGQPSFRIVVQEHTSPIKGKFIETLGQYLPSASPKEFKADLERIKHWISVGAQPSDTLAVLLKNEGLESMDKFIEPRNKKRKKKREVAAPKAAETPTAPEATTAPTAPETPTAPEATTTPEATTAPEVTTAAEAPEVTTAPKAPTAPEATKSE